MKKTLLLFLVILFSINSQVSSGHKQEARIEQYQELFLAFPKDIQEKIKKGQVEKGYTKNMVYIAIGSPSKMSTVGEKAIWDYWVESPKPKDLYPLESLNYPYLSIHIEFSGDIVNRISRIDDTN
ncbi:MAG: hypothetical protein ACI9S8_001092 [Chlamydiales bacterium]|jgi:hypothetical protein